MSQARTSRGSLLLLTGTETMDNNKSTNPVIASAQDFIPAGETIKTLSTGTRVRFVPVAAALLEDVSGRVPDPEVPMVYIESKDRNEANPSDPSYQRALKEAASKRSKVVLDAMILFGFELVDEIPAVEEWLPKLKFMEKRGAVDLSEYDLDNELDLRFVYMKFIAVGSDDIMEVGRVSGISEKDIKRAEKSFRSN